MPRYIAIRVRKWQGQLWADGNEVKYFVVASNQWDWDAVRLLNVLTALKRLARPEKWLTARPKKKRFQIFCSPGNLVSHARRTWLRVRRLKDQLAEWIEALHLLPIPVRTQVFLRTD